MAINLAYKTVGAPDNAFAWYLHTSGGTLAGGVTVGMGDGTDTPLFMDTDGIGWRTATGFLNRLRCAATANQDIVFHYTAGQGRVFPELVAVLANDASNSTVTASAVPSFGVSLAASTVYEFELILLFRTALAATAPRFRLNGPSGQTAVIAYRIQSAATTAALTNPGTETTQMMTAWGSDFLPTASLPVADVVYPYFVKGIIRTTGTAPTQAVGLEIWSETAASAITLAAGSVMKFRKLN